MVDMTPQEAIEKLKAKAECMKREISGTDIDCNLRRCDDCELCYAQGTCGEQIQAIEALINATSRTFRHKRQEHPIGVE